MGKPKTYKLVIPHQDAPGKPYLNKRLLLSKELNKRKIKISNKKIDLNYMTKNTRYLNSRRKTTHKTENNSDYTMFYFDNNSYLVSHNAATTGGTHVP